MVRDFRQKVIINSVLAVSSVIALNLFVLYLLNFPQMATLQIKKYLPLLFFLISGFGVQVGLYTYLKCQKSPFAISSLQPKARMRFPSILKNPPLALTSRFLIHKNPVSPITTVASGGTSSIAMILCCSHYLINIAPFIGVSALSIFADYTREILLFGIVSNISGVSIMIYKIKNLGKNEQQTGL